MQTRWVAQMRNGDDQGCGDAAASTGGLHHFMEKNMRTNTTIAVLKELINEDGTWGKQLRRVKMDFDRALHHFINSALPPPTKPPHLCLPCHFLILTHSPFIIFAGIMTICHTMNKTCIP